ncbi:MAG: hypothetical protein LBC38_05520 [Oscillospiraceae bacterium]|jgi:hypothetical protein|nr:hypothetical protein [Oscillospiraceae bacterium]
MKYPRPAFGDPNYTTTKHQMSAMFGGGTVDVPKPDYPIPIRENFRRAAKRAKPMWIPNGMTDIDSEMVANLTGWGEADWSRKDRYEYIDQFGCRWTFVPEAGGPMLTVGTRTLDDITEWPEKVKFPDLSQYNIEERCAEFLKKHDPDKVLHINIGLGCTERLVAVMGGYEDAMIAMAMEPKAVSDFLEAFVDSEIELVDELLKYLPIDFITYHDDWGTERDTFFGEQMMEDIVFKPTLRLFEHIRSKNIVIQQHSCGRIKRFMPYFIKLGVDFLQIQERPNDFAAYKREYGRDIGIEVMASPGRTKEELIAGIHKMIDTYAAHGGVFTNLFAFDPEMVWAGVWELYLYSREYYDKENAES